VRKIQRIRRPLGHASGGAARGLDDRLNGERLPGGDEVEPLPSRRVVQLEGRVEQRFVAAVQRREVGPALRTLDRLLAAEEPVRLLALLVADVRATMTVADLAARGQAVDQIARVVRKPPQVVDAIARGPASASRATLARRLARCWEAERRMKSSGDARAELAALVVDLCR